MRAGLWMLFFLMASFTYPKRPGAAIALRGIVMNAETGLPVHNVYIYSVKGEEETLTDKNGEFKIVSWQPLPVSLIVQHAAYEEKKISISYSSKTILIKLKKK